MAIGKVFDYPVEIKDLGIFFGQGDHRFRIDAEVLDRDEAPLAEISETMKKNEIHIEVVLGNGPYSERVWGCDLTEGYIDINARYTT